MGNLLTGSTISLAAFNGVIKDLHQSVFSLNQKYPEDASPDGAYWEALKKHYLLEDDLIMMNCGTVGPMPKAIVQTVMKYTELQATNPFQYYEYVPKILDDVRLKLASFINAAPEEVVITANSTEGLNIIANGLDMEKGDEVIVSDMEHPSSINPWKLKAKRYGIKIREVPFGIPAKSVDEIVDSVAAAISPRTKIICLGHTVYITGQISPLKELSRLARDRGILIGTDSAHGLGMLNLDMKKLDVDFLVSSPYKWMGAPAGTGVLYVRKEAQDRLWPTIVGFEWDVYKDARKLKPQGQRSHALTLGLGEAVDFNLLVGKDRIERRVKALSSYLKQELKKISAVKVHTPDDPYLSGGLTAFSLGGVSPDKYVDYVRSKYNIIVRTIGCEEQGSYGIRVSTPIYISYKEIDMLVEAINHLLKHRS